MPRWIDSHCHVAFPGYDGVRDEVMQRMRDEGVWGITVGTTTETSRQAVAYAESHDGVFATVGHHPEHFSSSYEFDDEPDAHEYHPDQLEQIAGSSKKVVAIGETGLDFFRMDEGTDRVEAQKKQEDVFRTHIAIAKRLHLPVVIHCRDALMRLAEIVAEEKQNGWDGRAVVHCFTGTWAEAEPLLNLGLHLSFTGIITFPPKKGSDPEQQVHRVIERMPMDRLMIETDAPYLTPVPHRGEQNEPAYVRYVGEKIAEIRGLTVDAVSKQTIENTKNFFGI